MCLIAVSPSGTEKNSELFLKALDNGTANNKDGVGIGWKLKGEQIVHWKKGLKNEEFLDFINKLNLKKDDCLVVHFRFASAGDKAIYNCHPFVLSRKMDEILSLEGITQNGIVFHNGTMLYYKTEKSAYSDTYHFVKELMCVPEMKELLRRDAEEFYSIFQDKLNEGRFIFLFPNNSIYLGDWKEDSGYMFSNDSYKDISIINKGDIKDDEDAFQAIVTNTPTIIKKKESLALTEGLNIDKQDRFMKNLMNLAPPRDTGDKLTNRILDSDIPVLEENSKFLYFYCRNNNEFKTKMLEGGHFYRMVDFNSDCGMHLMQDIKDVGYSFLIHHDDLLKACVIYVNHETAYANINLDFKRLRDVTHMSRKGYKALKNSYERVLYKKKGLEPIMNFRTQLFHTIAVGLFVRAMEYKFEKGKSKIKAVFTNDKKEVIFD